VIHGHDFPGVEQLRAQLSTATASPGCRCGCGTIEVHVPDGLPASPAESPVPVEATVLDAGGEPVGGLLLFLGEGRLSALEVYAWDDVPLPLPPVDRVSWD
jgi:hypothetical protein